MEPSIAELITGGVGLFGSGWGLKILTEVIRQKLKDGGNGNGKKPEVPKATNGFIDHAYLSGHCRAIQESCAKVMGATLQAEIAPIKEQLSSGKDVMQRTIETLDRHERVLDDLRKK